MAEYIEREAFLKDIEERYCLPCKEAGKDHSGCKCRACWVDDMRGDVIDEPAADVVPVRHGRWERTADGAALCTACKRKMNPSQYGYAFCSLCGAKMDGGED